MGLTEDEWATLKLADNCVYADQDSPQWSPNQRSEVQLTYWAVSQAQGVLDNGGLQYFFENDWPQNPPYKVFIDAFRRVGAKEAADWLEDAAAMFPFENPQDDYKRRRQFLDDLKAKEGGDDSIIDKLGDRLITLSDDTYKRLVMYVRGNIAEFKTTEAEPPPPYGSHAADSPSGEA